MNRKNNRLKQSQKKYEIDDINIRLEMKKDIKELNDNTALGACDFDLFVQKTMAELFLGLSAKAIESAQQALTLKDNSFYGWYLLGCAYLDEHQFTDAYKAYEKALNNFDKKNEKPSHLTALDDIIENLEVIGIFGSIKEENNEG